MEGRRGAHWWASTQQTALSPAKPKKRKADEAALESECGEAAHDPRHVIVIGHVQTFVDVPEATCLGCTTVREAFEAPTFYFVHSCVNCRGLCETERR